MISLHLYDGRRKQVVRVHDSEPILAAGILFVAKDKVLVLKRSKSSNNPGMWDLPGGKAEAGETPKQAAIRETEEEIGLDPHSLEPQAKYIKEISHTVDDVDYHTFICYCDEFKPKLNEEHSKYKWVELDDLPNKLHPHLKDLLDNLVLGKVQ